MQTSVLPFDDLAIAEAARLIKAGQVVAVPTETVYGLAGDATSNAAVAGIFAAKGRPAYNPLIVHVASLDDALSIGSFNATAMALAQKYWPGPLTIVVPLRRDAKIAAIATAGLATVALRVPRHRAMQALLKAAMVPLAAPSANASGSISPTCPRHILRTLDGRIPLIIDDGPTEGGVESTIIGIEGENVRLLRPGPLSIAQAVPRIESAMIDAPGQMAKHYAPSKPLRLNAVKAGEHEWHLGFGDVAGNINLSSQGNLGEAAMRLFDLLHAADTGPAARIAVAPIPETGLGIAINDRLRRAAAPAS